MTDKSLLQFPTEFQIKVFGPNDSVYIEAIIDRIREHHPNFDPHTALRKNPSKKNTYISLTITVYVTSQAELDRLYELVYQHPDTKMVL